jgi:TRAP-type transport system small permease protein
MSAPKTLLRRAAEVFLAATLTGMVVAVFANVVLRYAFGTGIVIAEELSRLLFVWLVAIGAIVAAADHQHLGLDLLTSRLPPKARIAVGWLADALVVLVLAILIWGSWKQVEVGLTSLSPVMKYPQALAAASTLVMSLAMLVLLGWQRWTGDTAPTLPAADVE